MKNVLNRTISLCVILVAALSLTACGKGVSLGPDTEVRLDLLSVTQYTNGEQLVLKGFIVPQFNFGGQVTVTDGGSIACEGETSPKGDGEMRCTDSSDGSNFLVMLDIPEDIYGGLHGSYITTNEGVVGVEGDITAAGWGRDADEATLRQMLATAIN